MIEKDPRVVKMLESVKNRSDLDVNEMVQISIDALRALRFPSPHSKEIIKARASLSDGRSKLIDRRLSILQELALLKGAMEDLTNYVLAKYSNYFSSVKNQKNRDAIVSKALSPINKKIRKLESGLEIINNIIADFDSRAFAIRDVILAIQLGEREV